MSDEAIVRSKAELTKRIHRAIAVYLLAAALFAVVRIGSGGIGMPGNILSIVLMAVLLGASLAGGVGLLLGKNWGYWTAVTVLTLHIVKIQYEGFTYDMLSLVGIYVYAGGKLSIGISAAFDPSFYVSSGTGASWWFGVNIFVVLLVTSLLSSNKTHE